MAAVMGAEHCCSARCPGSHRELQLQTSSAPTCASSNSNITEAAADAAGAKITGFRTSSMLTWQLASEKNRTFACPWAAAVANPAATVRSVLRAMATFATVFIGSVDDMATLYTLLV